MRSGTLFFIIAVALALSIVGIVFGLANWHGGKGQGMSGAFLRSFWPILAVVPLVVFVVVLGYVMLFPELTKKASEDQPFTVPVVEEGESALNSVLQVLKDDERKVVETLAAEGGMMLQKDIRWKDRLFASEDA